MRCASVIPLALALLSIHCLRAASAAEDSHHRAAAEQQQASSCPAPSSSAAALQATVEQLLHEIGNLRRDMQELKAAAARDMQELKAAAARPAPGTIVDSTNLKCGWLASCSCPEGSKKIYIGSDQGDSFFLSLFSLFPSGTKKYSFLYLRGGIVNKMKEKRAPHSSYSTARLLIRHSLRCIASTRSLVSCDGWHSAASPLYLS